MKAHLFLFSLLCLFPVMAQVPAPGPQAGQKVAFMGDSITAYGWNHPAGYVQLVAKAMELSGKKIVPIPAGVSGNTSRDMLAPLDRDVLGKKPDWMTLSCGVNDVWHGPTGCTLEEYEKNINSILDQAQAAGIKVVLLTATMINEDQANANNQKLIPYNDFIRAQAKARNLPLADLNADMQAALAQARTENPTVQGNLLTEDGVHMNAFGDQMMATGVLKAFGLTDAQIAQARTVWMNMPGAMRLAPTTLTLNQYIHLRAVAASQGKTVEALVSDTFDKALDTLTNAPISVPVSPAAENASKAPVAKP